MAESKGLTFQAPVEYRPRHGVLVVAALVTILALGITLWVRVDNPVTGAVRAGTGNSCPAKLNYYSVAPLSSNETLHTDDGTTLRVGEVLGNNEDGSQAVCLKATGGLVVGNGAAPSTVSAEGAPVPLWRALWPGSL